MSQGAKCIKFSILMFALTVGAWGQTYDYSSTLDNEGKITTYRDTLGSEYYAYPYSSNDFSSWSDDAGNQIDYVRNGAGQILEKVYRLKNHSLRWYEHYIYDAAGNVIFNTTEWGSYPVRARSQFMGIPYAEHDWIQIIFPAVRTINEIKVYTVQDAIWTPATPSDSMLFTKYGLTDFEVQYWNAALNQWSLVTNGSVTGNRNVVRTFNFAPVSTQRIRVIAKNSIDGGYSKIAEIEAFQVSPRANVALASAGSRAVASTTYAAGGNYAPGNVINGERTGWPWGDGGAWADYTYPFAPIAAPTKTVTDYPDGTTLMVVQNGFAKVTRLINNNPVPPKVQMGQPFKILHERTEVARLVLNVGMYKTDTGYQIWDDKGGARRFGFNQAGKLYWVADDRHFLKIQYDELGRPTWVHLGDDVRSINFVYDASGWLSTELVDRQRSVSFYKVTRYDGKRKEFPRSLAQTRVIMPGHGTLVEWNDQIDPNGSAVATLNGRPYAYIPLSSTTGTPSRYSLTLFEDLPEVRLQIDYTPDLLYVRFPTNAGITNSDQHEAVYVFARDGGSSVAATSAASSETDQTNSASISNDDSMMQSSTSESPEPAVDEVQGEPENRVHEGEEDGWAVICDDAGNCVRIRIDGEIIVRVPPEPPAVPPLPTPESPVDISECTGAAPCVPPPYNPNCNASLGQISTPDGGCTCPQGSRALTNPDGEMVCSFALIEDARPLSKSEKKMVEDTEALIEKALSEFEECRDLFKQPASWVKNGHRPPDFYSTDVTEAMDRAAPYNGNQIAKCDKAGVRGFAAPHGPYIYLCDDFFQLSMLGNERAVWWLHEVAHTNGLPEDEGKNPPPGSLSDAEINGKIRNACKF